MASNPGDKAARKLGTNASVAHTNRTFNIAWVGNKIKCKRAIL
jgi:hypothetical protein